MKKTINRITKSALALTFAGLGNLTAQTSCNASFTCAVSSSSVSVSSTSTGTTATTSYEWNLSGFQTGYGSSYGFGPLYNGTYTVYLSIYDSLGCTSSASQTISVSGSQNPPACTASFTINQGNNGKVNLITDPINDPFNMTYCDWTFSDNTGLSQVPFTDTAHSYYYNGTYHITANVYNHLSGCTTNSTQTVSITNAAGAPACTSAFTYTLGNHGEADFSSLYGGSAPVASFYWDFGNGQYSQQQNPINYYPYNGTYTVTMYVEDSLASCSSQSSQVVTITTASVQPCTPSVSFNGHADSLQSGIWNVYPYYSQQVTNAIWYWGDGSSTQGLYPSHTYSAAGHYNICVTALTNCGDSAYYCQNDSIYRVASNNGMVSVNVISTVAGIKNNVNDKTSLHIYPNPNNGLFTMQLDGIETNSVAITITNIIGETLHTYTESLTAGKITRTIDLSSLDNGAYFIKVNNKMFKMLISK